MRDVMMPVVFAIPDDTTIAAASALMAGEGVHRLPVLDASGAVVGILSTLAAGSFGKACDQLS